MVKTKTISTPKITDHGAQCMMLGYVAGHMGDCNRMWDPITNGIHESHDVIWMRRMFYTRDIGQDIMGPPMVIPGINDQPPIVTQEGIGATSMAGVLPRREGDASGLDNLTVPAWKSPKGS
jgi:hypothetical protein